MSRFVLATLGSLGDLHPYIAVGRALRRAGISRDRHQRRI